MHFSFPISTKEKIKIGKYKHRHRIPSARLQHWDYGSNGTYFITICTQNREQLFGKIIGGEIQLNEMGQLAEKYWSEIPDHFPFIKLGNFMVMPNHHMGFWFLIDRLCVLWILWIL